MQSKDFNRTIDIRIKDVEQNSFEQICTKPSENSWSLAQVCVHLIDSANYFLEQVAICVSNNENANEEMAPNAKTMFLNNEFPNDVIEEPSSNDNTRQPDAKEEVLNSFAKIKEAISYSETQISKSIFKGKTKHPGLKYFSANEWLQFADMHFRHHLRQNNRIKTFLKLK